MKWRGFTIVELIITITIMGILLVLVVVNVNSSQIRSRDDERKADIAAIQNALETFYTTGMDNEAAPGGSTLPGTYPAVELFTTDQSMLAALRDIDKKSLTPPNATEPALLLATNATQTATGVLPQPTISQYVYQPIDSSGNRCYFGSVCRKFNLYYRLEGETGVQMVMSRNQ